MRCNPTRTAWMGLGQPDLVGGKPACDGGSEEGGVGWSLVVFKVPPNLSHSMKMVKKTIC